MSVHNLNSEDYGESIFIPVTQSGYGSRIASLSYGYPEMGGLLLNKRLPPSAWLLLLIGVHI